MKHLLQSNDASCNPTMLITDLHYTCRQRREHSVFNVLLQMVVGLEDRLMEGTEDDASAIATMVSWLTLLPGAVPFFSL